VRDELIIVSGQRDIYRRILSPQNGDNIATLATFLDRFDMSTVHPLLLHLAEIGMGAGEWREVAALIESYLCRRAVCGLSVKNYTRMFLNLTRRLRDDGASASNIRQYLSELSGDGFVWPSDARFKSEWRGADIYARLSNRKLVHFLLRLSDTYNSSKTESIVIVSPLTIEHIMPQAWTKYWPMDDGSLGLSDDQLDDMSDVPHNSTASRQRSQLTQTLGNLTIVTQELNTAVSNGPWHEKKPALLAASLLPINLQLATIDAWNEGSIATRSE